jgi:uncharacterized protein
LVKLIFIIGITVFLVYLLKNLGRRGSGGAPKTNYKSEDMVRCQVCGVNLPRSEALMRRGRIYCCAEHQQKDQPES